MQDSSVLMPLAQTQAIYKKYIFYHSGESQITPLEEGRQVKLTHVIMLMSVSHLPVSRLLCWWYCQYFGKHGDRLAYLEESIGYKNGIKGIVCDFEVQIGSYSFLNSLVQVDGCWKSSLRSKMSKWNIVTLPSKGSELKKTKHQRDRQVAIGKAPMGTAALLLLNAWVLLAQLT